MMNETRFEALARRARSESPPCVDVAGRVMAILSSERVSDRPLIWLAAVSSAVAVPVAVLAVVVYNTWIGPLFEISRVIAWVTQ